VPALNAGDLTNLRTRPIGRRWTFYVYQPVTVWIGTVGGAPSRGDRSLTVATVSGNPADIIADSTIWCRDAADDYKNWPSKVRARSYGAPTLTVADNDIDWTAGDRLHAVRLFEIWPRIVWINAAGVQFKDRDIAWVDDATTQPPVANAGPAAIGTLSGGQLDLVFTNAGSFTVPTGGAVASYLWAAIGGAPAVVAGALNSSTVTLRYTTAGFYYVSLTVTDANGKTGVRYVPVIVDDGTLGITENVPIDRYWDGHGWALSRRLLGIDADESEWFDGAPAFLVADTQITATGAFIANRSNLRWSGWLTQDQTATEFYSREINYRAVSSAHILATVPSFPIGVRLDAAPADWYEITQCNLDSVVCYLLNWHSTVLRVCDYHATGEWTTRDRPGENCRADNLLAQVNDVLHACFANIRCDRQGVLRAMRDEWHLSAAEQAARATVLTLTNPDWSKINYGPREHRARVSQTKLLGVDGSSNPYIAGSPGDAPLDGGRPHEVQKLGPISQAELNQWAGQELATENFQFPLRLVMSGEYDCVDPALGEFVAGTLSSFDDKLPDGPYSVLGVRFRDEQDQGHTIGEWELSADPGEALGHTRDIPVSPDEPDPPDMPPIDEYPEIIIDEWPLLVLVITNDGAGNCGVYLSEDFSGPEGAMPTWTDLSGNLPGGANNIAKAQVDAVDPYDYWYIQQAFGGGNPGSIWRSTDQGASWSLIFSTADVPANYTIKDFGCDKILGGYIAVVADYDLAGINYLYTSTDYGATFGAAENLSPNGVYHNDGYDAYNGRRCTWYWDNNLNGFKVRYDEGGGWASSDGIGTSSTNYGYSVISFMDGYYWFSAWDGSTFRWTKVDPVAVAAYISFSGGIGAVPATRQDQAWFHPTTGGNARLVYPGTWGGGAGPASRLGVTVDHFATDTIYTLGAGPPDIYNINSVVWRVVDNKPLWLIYGSEGYSVLNQNANFYPTAHCILVADATIGNDYETVYGKAGSMAATAPYTDSIPRVSGGPVDGGICILDPAL
jgi:hypothetical protein